MRKIINNININAVESMLRHNSIHRFFEPTRDKLAQLCKGAPPNFSKMEKK